MNFKVKNEAGGKLTINWNRQNFKYMSNDELGSTRRAVKNLVPSSQWELMPLFW